MLFCSKDEIIVSLDSISLAVILVSFAYME